MLNFNVENFFIIHTIHKHRGTTPGLTRNYGITKNSLH